MHTQYLPSLYFSFLFSAVCFLAVVRLECFVCLMFALVVQCKTSFVRETISEIGALPSRTVFIKYIPQKFVVCVRVFASLFNLVIFALFLLSWIRMKDRNCLLAILWWILNWNWMETVVSIGIAFEICVCAGKFIFIDSINLKKICVVFLDYFE